MPPLRIHTPEVQRQRSLAKAVEMALKASKARAEFERAVSDRDFFILHALREQNSERTIAKATGLSRQMIQKIRSKDRKTKRGA